MLTRDIIVQAATPKTESIEIPEFQHEGQPVTLTIRALSSEQANRLVELDSKDPDSAVARWISESVVGEDGQRMFTEEDVPTIRGMAARGIKRLYDAILELNGLAGQAAKN